MHKQVQAQAKLCKSPHLTKSTVVKRRAPHQQESKRTLMSTHQRQKLGAAKASTFHTTRFQQPQDSFAVHKQTISTQAPQQSFETMNDCDQGCLALDNTTPKCPCPPTLPNSQYVQRTVPAKYLDPSTLSMQDCVTALSGRVLEVEGNIGCGKSTLTKMMAKILNNTKAGITDEVTVSSLSKGDTTTNDIMATSSKINGEYNDEIFALLHGELVNQTFLSSFYTNPQRYGFAFQMYMLTTRLFQMQTASFYAKNYGQFQLLDRGAVGDALFALYNASAGNITDEELSVYKSVCADRLPSSLSHKVDIVAFLDVSPLECYRRMNSMRQRDAEKEVVPDYLEGLDQSYFELMVKWLGHRTDACGGINIGLPPPVVIFDWSEFGCSKAVLQKLARAALSHDEQVQYLKSIKHQFTGEEELDQVRATRQVAHNVLVRPEVHFLQPGQEDINQLSELTTVDIVTDEAQLEALYNEITETKLIMGRDGRPVQHLVVDWALPHTNSFRRVVMKHLAREGQVTFINSDHTGLVM